MSPSDAPAVIPAATLILLRDAAAGPPQILVVERAQAMAFGAGALVFPGGRVDDADVALARDGALLLNAEDLDEAETAARIAAVRETIEEVGVAVALVPEPDHAGVEAFRAALHGGADFTALIASAGYRLDLAALIPLARWQPPTNLLRNFDTRFYVAAAPEGALGTADGTESLHAAWRTARDMLSDEAEGRCRLMFPTLCNLQRLAQFDTTAEIQADARRFEARLIIPQLERVADGVRYLRIPDDLGYPCTVQRVEMHER